MKKEKGKEKKRAIKDDRNNFDISMKKDETKKNILQIWGTTKPRKVLELSNVKIFNGSLFFLLLWNFLWRLTKFEIIKRES